jgi:hypothetical protein
MLDSTLCCLYRLEIFHWPSHKMRCLISFELVVASQIQILTKLLKMRQKETIKPLVRSVINKIAIVALLMIPFFTEAQTKKELKKEQYKVIEDSFKNSGKESTKIFYQTIDYKSWVHLLYGDYYREKRGIVLCSFEDPQLERSIDQLSDHVMNIQVKELNPKKLSKRFILIKDLKDDSYLSVTEPIIIGNYSFMLFKYQYSESLEVQKKNQNGDWEYEC